MLPEELPPEILARFRNVSLERVQHIEALWSALTSGGGGGSDANASASDLQRELHTLKGDSRVVGFADINLLCHRLEDVLAAGRRRGFRVSEDLDLAATMGFRILDMLLRRRTGTQLSGIDLVGFVDQLDQALRGVDAGESPAAGHSRGAASGAAGGVANGVADRPVERGGSQGRPAERAKASATTNGSLRSDHLGPEARAKLAWAATRVFLEHLNSGGKSRARLHDVWLTLSSQLAALGQEGLSTVLARHAHATAQLARDLGKQVDLRFEMGDVAVNNDVGQAIDVAVLHLLRNAVDHGIEAPLARRACGKPLAGRVTIRARRIGQGGGSDDGGGDGVELEIEDDGAGVDFAAVAKRARADALVTPGRAPGSPDAGESEMIDWLFRPGFTTASSVSDVSGRGLGLDAVRAALQPYRGTIEFRTRAQVGSLVKLRIAHVGTRVQVRHFLAPRGDLRLAVLADWRARVGDASVDAIDALGVLGVLPAMLARARRTVGVRLTRGNCEVMLAGGGAVAEGTVDRICPTDDEVPVEVVRLERAECLLLRPELFQSRPS